MDGLRSIIDGMFQGMDQSLKVMRENQQLRTTVAELVALLRRVDPHLDAIVCYASTMGEHEPNRIVHDIREAIAKHGGG